MKIRHAYMYIQFPNRWDCVRNNLQQSNRLLRTTVTVYILVTSSGRSHEKS